MEKTGNKTALVERLTDHLLETIPPTTDRRQIRQRRQSRGWAGVDGLRLHGLGQSWYDLGRNVVRR